MFFCAANRDSSIAYFGGSRRRVQWETALVVIFNSAARADGPPKLCTKLLTLTKIFFLNYVSIKLHFVIKKIKHQKQIRVMEG